MNFMKIKEYCIATRQHLNANLKDPLREWENSHDKVLNLRPQQFKI